MNNQPSRGNIALKPYKLIPFPKEKPPLDKPIGHHKYYEKRIHGTLHLCLTVETAVHVSTGIVAMGSDIGQNRIPLIKTMMQDGDGKSLIIPGSSFKGVVRSIYEAITNSTLGVVTGKYSNKIPRDRLPCKNKESLCPASRVFGAMDWQGLIDFNDAKCQSVSSPGFMTSLYSPRPTQSKKYYTNNRVAGRKFYYHADKAISKGENRGIAVQQAAKKLNFTTQLGFKNLTEAELGVLLIALGQDTDYPMALKIGAGKPIGMGTMTVKVTGMNKPQNIRDRYLNYNTESQSLTEQELQQTISSAIAAAHQNLIQTPQLIELQKVLAYPTNRKAPDGNY